MNISHCQESFECEHEREHDESSGFLKGTNSAFDISHYFKTRIFIVITLLNICLSISIAALATVLSRTPTPLNAELRKTSTYSPLHDLLDLEMHPTRINGTIFPLQHDASFARELPNPAADAIWADISSIRIFPVTSDQITKMGSDVSTVVKLPDSMFGLGNDAYATTFDTDHHLHCLNMLRKMIYADYYDMAHSHFTKFKKGMFEIHMNHCVDVLMQTIRCSGNVNLLPMHWLETEAGPVPDMSARRQCVDFDRLKNWRDTHTVDQETWKKMRKPEGVRQLRSPDGFYEYIYPNIPNLNHLDGANPGKDFNF